MIYETKISVKCTSVDTFIPFYPQIGQDKLSRIKNHICNFLKTLDAIHIKRTGTNYCILQHSWTPTLTEGWNQPFLPLLRGGGEMGGWKISLRKGGDKIEKRDLIYDSGGILH